LEKRKIEAGEKDEGMHGQQKVTYPEVAGTGHSAYTHGTRVTLSLVMKCGSTTTNQKANIRVQNGNSRHVLSESSDLN
jgi:hypothetical protein